MQIKGNRAYRILHPRKTDVNSSLILSWALMPDHTANQYGSLIEICCTTYMADLVIRHKFYGRVRKHTQ
jgi:hypothetical protein